MTEINTHLTKPLDYSIEPGMVKVGNILYIPITEGILNSYTLLQATIEEAVADTYSDICN